MADDSVADDEFFGIGEVLEILLPEFEDLSISKIRFLESQGLIEPQRTYSGFRKFYKKDIERLKWILEQQRDHFLPLKVIKQKLKDIELNREPTPLAKIAELKKTARKTRKKSTVPQSSHLPLKPADYMEQSEIEKALNSIYNEITSAQKATSETLEEINPNGTIGDDIRVVEFDDTEELLAELEYLNRATSNIEQSKNEEGANDYVVSDDEVIDAQQSYDDVATSIVSSNILDDSKSKYRFEAYSGPSELYKEAQSHEDLPEISVSNPHVDAVASNLGESDFDSQEPIDDEDSQWSATSEIDDFAKKLGCKPELVTEMVEMGFVEPDDIAGIKSFGRDCYEIANTILVYQRHGFEMRHIKLLLNAAQRESALYLQVLRPILKRRNPDSKYEARELGQILMRAGAKLHQDLLRRDLRKELKG